MSLPFEIESRMSQLLQVVSSCGCELIEVQFRRSGSRGFLTFLVDKKGSVTLEDCAAVNRALGDYLDRETESAPGETAVLSGSYLLEVNSPGLDRPLKTAADFMRVIGQGVRVAWRSQQGAGLVAEGELLQVDEGGLVVRVGSGKEQRIEFHQVTKASRNIKI